MNISGRRDHAIVEYGKQVLLNLMHRGAAGADESTGDGAGILLQTPARFLPRGDGRAGLPASRPQAVRRGDALPAARRGTPPPLRADLRRSWSTQDGLKLLGWRDVPTDNGCLGDLARTAEPVIRQVFIDGQGREDEDLERRLYVVRKRIERRVAETLGAAADEFYVPSMSCRTIVYKGMFLAPQLFAYYPDLADQRVRTALAIVHQRYSTNTFPELAAGPAVPHDRPQRRDQHAARQRQPAARPREDDGRPRRLTDDMSELFPILQPGGSDSACFDNAMELLVRAGRSAPHALMMMIPEAFGPRYYISTDKRAFYEYHAAIMEPWDGPAAMVFTDGRLVGGTLGPQRPAALPLRRDHRRAGGAGQRGGRDRVPARADPAERPSSARPHVPGRYRRGPDRRRQRDQGQDLAAEALSPLAGREPHRAARAVSAVEADADRSARRWPSGCAASATPARTCRWSWRRWRPTARSRSARWAPTRRWPCSPTGRSCCSTISSNCSPR